MQKTVYEIRISDWSSDVCSSDLFANAVQSRNLREIATSIDPVFRAKNDVFQGNLEFDVTDTVKFVSQTAYARDRYFSTQDYNRYVSAPIFNDTLGLVDGDRKSTRLNSSH